MNWMGGARYRAQRQQANNINPRNRFNRNRAAPNRNNYINNPPAARNHDGDGDSEVRPPGRVLYHNNIPRSPNYTQHVQNKRPCPLLHFMKENMPNFGQAFALQLSHQMEIDSIVKSSNRGRTDTENRSFVNFDSDSVSIFSESNFNHNRNHEDEQEFDEDDEICLQSLQAFEDQSVPSISPNSQESANTIRSNYTDCNSEASWFNQQRLNAPSTLLSHRNSLSSQAGNQGQDVSGGSNVSFHVENNASSHQYQPSPHTNNSSRPNLIISYTCSPATSALTPKSSTKLGTKRNGSSNSSLFQEPESIIRTRTPSCQSYKTAPTPSSTLRQGFEHSQSNESISGKVLGERNQYSQVRSDQTGSFTPCHNVSINSPSMFSHNSSFHSQVSQLASTPKTPAAPVIPGRTLSTPMNSQPISPGITSSSRTPSYAGPSTNQSFSVPGQLSISTPKPLTIFSSSIEITNRINTPMPSTPNPFRNSFVGTGNPSSVRTPESLSSSNPKSDSMSLLQNKRKSQLQIEFDDIESPIRPTGFNSTPSINSPLLFPSPIVQDNASQNHFHVSTQNKIHNNSNLNLTSTSSFGETCFPVPFDNNNNDNEPVQFQFGLSKDIFEVDEDEDVFPLASQSSFKSVRSFTLDTGDNNRNFLNSPATSITSNQSFGFKAAPSSSLSYFQNESHSNINSPFLNNMNMSLTQSRFTISSNQDNYSSGGWLPSTAYSNLQEDQFMSPINPQQQQQPYSSPFLKNVREPPIESELNILKRIHHIEPN